MGPSRTSSPTGRRSSTRSRPGCGGWPTGRPWSSNIGDPGGEAVVDRLRERAIGGRGLRPGRRLARPRRLPARDRRAVRDGRRPGRRAPRPDRRRGRRRARPSRSTGWTRSAGAITIRLATAGRHNAANALAVAGAALSLGVAPDRDRGRHRIVPWRRPAAGAQGRGGRCRGLRRLRPPPDRHRRDARRRPPARARPARLGRLRAADLPSDRGHARCLRGGAGRRGRGRHRGHLGRPRP